MNRLLLGGEASPEEGALGLNRQREQGLSLLFLPFASRGWGRAYTEPRRGAYEPRRRTTAAVAVPRSTYLAPTQPRCAFLWRPGYPRISSLQPRHRCTPA
jgi:hypothetical protein